MCPLIFSLYTVKNHLFKNMLNITINVNAYACRPNYSSYQMHSCDCTVVKNGAFCVED